MPISPAKPQAWRGFSLLLADLALTLGGRFRAFPPPYFLSLSLLLADVQSAKSARQSLEKSVT